MIKGVVNETFSKKLSALLLSKNRSSPSTEDNSPSLWRRKRSSSGNQSVNLSLKRRDSRGHLTRKRDDVCDIEISSIQSQEQSEKRNSSANATRPEFRKNRSCTVLIDHDQMVVFSWTGDVTSSVLNEESHKRISPGRYLLCLKNDSDHTSLRVTCSIVNMKGEAVWTMARSKVKVISNSTYTTNIDINEPATLNIRIGVRGKILKTCPFEITLYQKTECTDQHLSILTILDDYSDHEVTIESIPPQSTTNLSVPDPYSDNCSLVDLSDHTSDDNTTVDDEFYDVE